MCALSDQRRRAPSGPTARLRQGPDAVQPGIGVHHRVHPEFTCRAPSGGLPQGGAPRGITQQLLEGVSECLHVPGRRQQTVTAIGHHLRHAAHCRNNHRLAGQHRFE